MNHGYAGSSSQERVDQRIARFAARRYGVISRAEAVTLGATRGTIESRLATGRWERLHAGVYRLPGAPASWRQALLAACLVAKSGAVASHRAAARLWRLAGFDADVVEISVSRGRRVRIHGVVAHEVLQLSAVDVTTVDAIPVTTPTRTLIDLAGVVEAEALEEALDDALRRGLTSMPRLRWGLSELGRPGRPGISLVRALIAARSHTEPIPGSVLERRFVRLLSRSGLPMPVRQYSVRDRGRVLAVVDFAYPDLKIAVEVDGYRWHSSRARWQRDLARRNALTSRGWRVVHFTAGDLAEAPDEVVQTIVAAVRSGSG